MSVGESYAQGIEEARCEELKVVYSEEQPIRPVEDMAISCKENCICLRG